MTNPRLELRDLTKSFFGSPVLESTTWHVCAGEMVALVGENGAGKSTLMNIIGGVLPPNRGEMRLDGEPYLPRNPAESRRLGVSLVHQELNLFENLTVGENLCLCDDDWWVVGPSRRRKREKIEALLRRVGLNRALHEPLPTLSPGERQLVEIAKAIRSNPKVLLFDEPTTSLSEAETEQLFSVIDDLKQAGIAIVYISHNLAHVKRISDRVIVLRDGKIQADGRVDDYPVDKLISLMVGREIEHIYPSRNVRPSSEVVFEVSKLTKPGIVKDVSLQLHRREILGLSGLMGSGRTELARLLFGADRFQNGQITLNGRAIRPSPSRAIRRGMAYVTESRREDGLLLDSSVEDNASLAALKKFAKPSTGWIRQKQASASVGELCDKLSLHCRSYNHQPVVTLSGGNQQKVVLAKWLLTDPKVFVLDEPTRGIDIGAKSDIYQLMNRLVEDGASILLISSELEELVGMCDRILVMSGGEIRREMRRNEFDRERLLRDAFGRERLG